jgi:PhzF family phenazine biosynthesis protein
MPCIENEFIGGFIMKQYVVDAFTDKVFHGNQAAVCVLEQWLPEDLMMDITRENNFSETAFTVKEGEKWHLRWFTPGGEIDLCGHATLGTAFVLMNYYEKEAEKIVFTTLSGDLIVTRNGELFEMEFPAYDMKPVTVTDAMEEALGVRPSAAYIARDLLCVLDDEQTVRELTPDLEKIKQIDGLLLHVTARGKDEDCVSRSFAPKLSVAEDPVCGSGHCHIIPYWADTLGKDELVAYQASKRGGTLYCRREGSKIFMAGKAALYSIDELFVDAVPERAI